MLWAFSTWKNCFAQVPGHTQLPIVTGMNELLWEFILPIGTVPPLALSPSPSSQHWKDFFVFQTGGNQSFSKRLTASLTLFRGVWGYLSI